MTPQDDTMPRELQESPAPSREPLLCRLHAVLLFCALLLQGGCASLPETVVKTPSYALTGTDGTQLGAAVQPLAQAHPGLSGFHILNDGLQAFAARLLLVQSAQRSLDLQYYIWHDDLTGRVLHNQLLAAADRGVRVRLLLDDLDTAGKEEMLHLIDAHPNIEIRLYNPFANRGLRAGDFVTDSRRVNHRMHNKSLTADNQASIFGGRNIGDEYFDAAEEVGFADLDVLAVGPVVGEVSQAFDLYWNSEWVYPLASFPPDSPVTAAEVKAFRRQSEADLALARASEYGVAIRALDIGRELNLEGFEYAWGQWVLVYDQPSKVEADEVRRETHLAPKLKEAMDRTEQDLIIVSPYFVPGSDFTDYLIGRVDQGVRVRIMTNSLAANDVPLVHAGYMRYREALIEGGVELYEYKASGSVKPGRLSAAPPLPGASLASLHAKYFGFDRRYLFVGSFNLDARSVAINTEMGVYFESPTYALYLSEVFDQIAITRGYRVTLDEGGDMQWTTREDGREVSLDREPDTSFWQRTVTRLLSLIAPESQL
jgi:putative cardiolipin synthase